MTTDLEPTPAVEGTRERMRVRVRVRRRPQPPSRRQALRFDNAGFRRALLRGDVGPGTYRVGTPSSAGALITIPSRIPPWVRTPHGRLWHRIRWATVLWEGPGVRDAPRLCVETWCGIGATRSRWGRRDPELAAGPGVDVCTWCETAKPDRRRLPDALAMEARDG